MRPKRISVISSANEPANIRLAPSWSWASYPGTSRTHSPGSGLQTLVELVSCHVIPKIGEVFGQLVGGELVVRGALFEIFGTYERRRSYFYCLDYRVRNHDIPLYFLPFAEEKGNPSLFLDFLSKVRKSSLPIAESVVSQVSNSRETVPAIF